MGVALLQSTFDDVEHSNPSTQCDLANGWSQFNSNCYKLEADLWKSWAAARHDYQGHLVSIYSEEQLSFLNGGWPTDQLTCWNLTDFVEEGHFEYTDGSQFVSDYAVNIIVYIRWNAGNPDNHNDEDCLSILINNGYWNDDNCDFNRGYICKRRGKMCSMHCYCHHLEMENNF
uniref:C-type lectin domain-containing protein n=1 Tax=Myripristis murdjan TaxID=586833 RepID=A0A667WU17_9TELE